jgi:hypothetical protein
VLDEVSFIGALHSTKEFERDDETNYANTGTCKHALGLDLPAGGDEACMACQHGPFCAGVLEVSLLTGIHCVPVPKHLAKTVSSGLNMAQPVERCQSLLTEILQDEPPILIPLIAVDVLIAAEAVGLIAMLMLDDAISMLDAPMSMISIG